MKASSFACALLVLLAVAVQLPAQQTEADSKQIAEIKAKAEKGDPDAEFDLGLRYHTGDGVPENEAEATKWLDKAAAQKRADAVQLPAQQSATNAAAAIPDWATNNATASTNSAVTKKTSSGGVFVENPDGSRIGANFDWEPEFIDELVSNSTNAATAAITNKYFIKNKALAEKGDSAAQVDFGWRYFTGLGVAKDFVETAKWFRKAADQGNVLAERNLGACYANGFGVPQDKAEAKKWYNKSVIDKFKETKALAEQGDADAQHEVGWDYLVGNPGASKDIVEAVKWLEMAGEQGNTNAQSELGSMYLWGNIFFGATKDTDKAIYWLRKIVGRTGDAEAENNLGAVLDEKQNYVEAAKWFRKAAEQGNADAQSNLGLIYHKGKGIETDDTEAATWFHKAAEQGDDKAQFYLGSMYHDGKGVTQDYAEALKWYRRAAAQGDDTAQNNLGLMYDKGEGTPQDYSEAYKWYNLAAAQGDRTAIANRDLIVRHMTPDQIAEAQRLAREFKPRKESGSDNSISSDSPTATGTGFFITDDGYLITNYHVVKGAAKVRLLTGAGLIDAAVVKVDAANDLALLKAAGRFAPLPIAASRTVKLGGTVATVGFPDIGLQGFAPKLAKGEIASLAGAADDPRFFQISVPVQHGNSGGALVDVHGNVVGIVAARLGVEIGKAVTSDELPENVNYAVKSSLLLSFLESVPDVAAKLKDPNTKDEAFEDVVKSAQDAAVLVLVY